VHDCPREEIQKAGSKVLGRQFWRERHSRTREQSPKCPLCDLKPNVHGTRCYSETCQIRAPYSWDQTKSVTSLFQSCPHFRGVLISQVSSFQRRPHFRGVLISEASLFQGVNSTERRSLGPVGVSFIHRVAIHRFHCKFILDVDVKKGSARKFQVFVFCVFVLFWCLDYFFQLQRFLSCVILFSQKCFLQIHLNSLPQNPNQFFPQIYS
jgi:hypothetical protein